MIFIVLLIISLARTTWTRFSFKQFSFEASDEDHLENFISNHLPKHCYNLFANCLFSESLPFNNVSKMTTNPRKLHLLKRTSPFCLKKHVFVVYRELT